MNIQLIQKQAKRVQGYAELIERKKNHTHNMGQYGFLDPNTKMAFKTESDSQYEARKQKQREYIQFMERRLAQAIEDLTDLT